MTTLDIMVMAAYLVVTLAVGLWFARTNSDANDYFLGNTKISWWAVMLSVVATETSALTVISVPGLAARTNWTFLQLAFGYVVGRIAVAVWLLPGYFDGTQETAYVRLEKRFGTKTRRLASGIFMIVRVMGDSVRVFATAIPLSIVTNWSLSTSILIVAGVALIYTWAGGIRAVIWVDVIQLGVYTLGGLVTIFVIASAVGGFGTLWSTASEAAKLRTFDWSLSLSTPYTMLAAVLGGALLSAASHGTDHLIVQRLLATKELRGARKALVGSGILVLIQFALFLGVGTALFVAGWDDGLMASDRIYPSFMVSGLPKGIAGLVVAGVLAAAMSTVSSSLNSLASSATHDFYAPITGHNDPVKLLKVGRLATLGWAVVLAGGALLFRSEQPVVELALSIASITYGSLLGAYIIMIAMPRVRQIEMMTAITASSIVMLVVVMGKPGPLANLAWPWYVPIGCAMTLVIAYVGSLVHSENIA